MNIKEKIEKWAEETFGRKEGFSLVHPKELENGDFALIVNDGSVEEYFEKLSKNKIEEIERIEFVKPRFINIYLSKKFFAHSINEINKEGKNFGPAFAKSFGEPRKIFIEHTQPNPFKEFHIGHLMNNTIGESVSRILRKNGAEVRVCSYHGDIGLHVAKTIWELLQSVEITLIKNAGQIGEAYVKGANLYEESPSIRREINEINKKIYDKTNKKINDIYQKGKEISLDGFQSIYKRLDSHFDDHFYESEAGEIGTKIVKQNIGKVFEESEGAVIFRGENFEPKTHTRVFLNKDGLPTYEAKEVGLAKIKKEKFAYDESITVTANEQDAFFNVVEVAIGQVFPELKGKLKHLSHGVLKLPGGKMSSRTGNIITAESLIDRVKQKIKEKIDDNNITEIIALGAIKYSILKQAIGGDITFDFDKSISFEGDSGPYLQYTAVRANSVLGKTKSQEPNSKQIQNPKFKIVNWETTEAERLLYRFPEVIRRAAEEYAPHHLVTYLIELAGSFNSFYAKEKIIDENDLTSPYKIALTQAVYYTLKNGLHILGIKVPEKM